MDQLQKKIAKSFEIIRKAQNLLRFKDAALAWTGGKDSTSMLHLIRTYYHGRVPYPVVFNDSHLEFPEIYSFIESVSKLWELKLIVVPHEAKDLTTFARSDPKERLRISRFMKLKAIRTIVSKYKFQALLAAIRWDEHQARSREKYFSRRSDHIRIHPMLHFTEKDIWAYIRKYQVPYVSLYDRGYRSLGEAPLTRIALPGEDERAGREPEKEQIMEELRNMGYW